MIDDVNTPKKADLSAYVIMWILPKIKENPPRLTHGV